jgi:hypothetical protein
MGVSKKPSQKYDEYYKNLSLLSGGSKATLGSTSKNLRFTHAATKPEQVSVTEECATQRLGGCALHMVRQSKSARGSTKIPWRALQVSEQGGPKADN